MGQSIGYLNQFAIRKSHSKIQHQKSLQGEGLKGFFGSLDKNTEEDGMDSYE
jgi:hypothetical protein